MNIYQRIVLILGVIVLIEVIWEPRINTYHKIIPFDEWTYIQKLYTVVSVVANIGTYEEYRNALRSPERRKRFYNAVFIDDDARLSKRIDWRGCKPKSYQDFEKKISDSLDDPKSDISPTLSGFSQIWYVYGKKYYKLEFKEHDFWKTTDSLLKAMGIIICTLLVFFALKGIGGKKGK